MRLHEAIDIEALLEARIITSDDREPLRDTDTIRVYHGASEIDTLYTALTRGLSGDMRAMRRFSFEANNNPRGLFVTPDLRTAKEFGDYVLELHVRVADLEAPVWPGGGFAVQGQMAGMFGDDEERNRTAADQRAQASRSQFDFVRASDRPDVAMWLMVAGERQALFTGDLNANSIRAVWISSDPTRVGQRYDRLSPREFLSIFSTEGVPNRFGSRSGPDGLKGSDLVRTVRNRILDPRDDVSGAEFIQALTRKHGKLSAERVLSILKDKPDYIRSLVWSDRQFNRIWNDIQRMR